MREVSSNTADFPTKRDNEWLLARLESIWDSYFGNIPQVNEVYIGFGRRSKYRFGSIRLRLSDNSTHIKINGLFKDPRIPAEIVDHTIAHELVHYSHGFSSLLPRMHQHPHRGGIIDKELNARNLGHLVRFYNSWVKEYVKELERAAR
jgi:hypothetical protein